MKKNGESLKVLIIDADQEVLSIAKFCLEKSLPAEVRSAFSVKEGLKAAAEFFPHLILLSDEISIAEGIVSLKKISGLEKTVVIILSSHKGSFDMSQYKSAGALDVIFKPIDPLLFPSMVKGAWLSRNF